MTTPSSVSRRRFIQRALAGSRCVRYWSRCSTALLSDRRGAAPPLRFLFVLEGNSVPPRQVCPDGIPFVEREARSKFVEHSLAGTTLPTALKTRRGVSRPTHHRAGTLGPDVLGRSLQRSRCAGAYHANQGRNIKAPTADALLGQAHPGIFENLVLGISSDMDKAVDFNCSAAARGRSLATLLHPDIAYTRLFGSIAAGKARSSFQARGNVLDYIKDDIKRAPARTRLRGERQDGCLSVGL